MENPTATNSINNKIVVLAGNTENLGSGIKIAKVNDEPVQDIQTTSAALSTSGSKFITEDAGTQIALGAFTVNTTAVTYNIFTNTAGLVRGIKITGVDGNLDEVSEVINTNGTSNVASTLTYLHINNIEQVTGSFLTSAQTVTCRASTGQDKRFLLNGTYKVCWGIMVGRKNGKDRGARLTSINQTQQTAATDYNLCVFPGTNSADVAAGLFNVAFRLRGFQNPLYGPINFGKCGAVDLKLGELAVWYRQSPSSTICNLQATWTYYNT